MVLFSLYFLAYISQGLENWFWGIPSVAYFLSAYGIFQLKKWARILALYFSIFAVILCIYFVFPLYCFSQSPDVEAARAIVLIVTAPFFMIGIPIIFFFTRPKVKEQFNK